MQRSTCWPRVSVAIVTRSQGWQTKCPSTALVRSEPQHPLLGFPLRSVSFANPSSTTCYMKHVLHILALLRPQDQAALGQLSHIWGAIQRHPQNFNPSQHFPWVMLMSPWTRLFEQNDAAEFMSHMLLRLRLPSMTGRWEARKVEEGRDLLRDEGLLHHPIALDIQGHTNLPDCLQAWHSQTNVHALAPLLRTDILGLQLLRFQTRGLVSNIVMLFVRTPDPLQLCWTTYRSPLRLHKCGHALM